MTINKTMINFGQAFTECKILVNHFKNLLNDEPKEKFIKFEPIKFSDSNSPDLKKMQRYNYNLKK